MIRLGGKDWIDILWACQSRLLSCLTMLSAQPSDLVAAKVHCRAPRQGLSCSFLLCFSNLRSCPVHKSQESCRVMQVESLRFFQDCRIRQSWLLQGSHRPSKQCGVALAIKQSQEKKNPENTLDRTLVLSVRNSDALLVSETSQVNRGVFTEVLSRGTVSWWNAVQIAKISTE